MARNGIAALRRGLFALCLVAVAANGASAQLVWDAITLYDNNASGTLAGQVTGTPTAGICPAGLTASTLLTSFAHNRYENPLLSGAIYPGTSWQPGAGSPVYNGTVQIPNKGWNNDGFFTNVCFRGAMGPNPGDDWTQGWTYYDSTGANRQDLHLAGMPDPRPLAVYHNINLTGCCNTWGPDSNYEVRGQLRVRNGGHLTVAPGTVIFEDVATSGTIVVERGGSLNAIGNRCEPIIITSNAAPGNQRRGDTGGLALLGRAPTNVVNSCAGDSAASEGGAIGYYGGNDSLDCSGVLRYVRVEYAGKEITPNNELNSFTWNACGQRTKGDYLQAFRGADDGFEWFGGSMSQKYLLAVDGSDDGLDTQLGVHNRVQFAIVRVNGDRSPNLGQVGERGIEADNNEFNHDQAQCAGRSNVIVSNVTLVGDKRTGPNYPGSTQGAELRRGTAYTIVNSIITNFKSHGIRVSDDATWRAHCSKLPVEQPLGFCGASLGIAPITEGNVFVASSQPNPFRGRVSFAFTLPQAGPVKVEIFSADGRRVDTIADEELAAGPHTLSWNVGQRIPAGLYFYKVLAGNHSSTGKVTHLE